MLNFLLTLLALLPFYLIGTLPVGFLVARAQGIDIRSVGSGNVGATNVARSLGKRAGVITLLGDVVKGLLACQLGYLFGGNDFSSLCGFAAIAGHCISIPPYLKGGKGVATTLGVLLGLEPLIAGIALLCFGIVFWMSRLVSLASLSAALLIPILALLFNLNSMRLACLCGICALVVFRHRANIARLSSGQEAKFSFGS